MDEILMNLDGQEMSCLRPSLWPFSAKRRLVPSRSLSFSIIFGSFLPIFIVLSTKVNPFVRRIDH